MIHTDENLYSDPFVLVPRVKESLHVITIHPVTLLMIHCKLRMFF